MVTCVSDAPERTELQRRGVPVLGDLSRGVLS